MSTNTAILVAMGAFDDFRLTDLPGATRDIMHLARVLERSQASNYSVQILTNTTASSASKQIEKSLQNLRRDDVVFFFYSGHGVLSRQGELFFATTDTCPETLRSTAIPSSFLHDVLNDCRSQSQVVMLDCCFSGAFVRNATGRGRIVITSSSATQPSFEMPRPLENNIGNNMELPLGAFTSAVVEGFTSGDADLNSDGKISCFELFNYVVWRLDNQGIAQTPRLSAFDVAGDIVLAVSNRRTINPKTQN